MNQLVAEVLEKIEPVVQHIVTKFEDWHLETFERPAKKYDLEWRRLMATYELVRSIETYALSTDELVEITHHIGNNGNVVVSALIKRLDAQYHFQTDVIYAGGYNIQTLHFRYITKTNLPKAGKLLKALELKEAIKNLTKIEKLQQEIETANKQIENAKAKVNSAKLKTDDDILNILITEKDYSFPTWETIVERGAHVNFDNEADFNKKQIDYKESSIKHWKYMNIDSNESYIKANERNIVKLQNKINQIKIQQNLNKA